jgi:iron complex outermembrane receptor protein
MPIVGADNRITGIHSLTASLSGRYDDYSDVGDTFNPKVGVNYRPVEWINVRANWGEAFTAPTLATSAAIDNSILVLSPPPLVNPFQPPPQGQIVREVAGQGGDPNTQPQEAETYSVGLDVQLPFAEGLSLSLTYYNVKIESIIGLTPTFTTAFYQNYPEYFVMSPTQAQVEAFASGFPGGLNAVAGLFAPGAPPVYMLIDGRRRNLGATKVDGVDLAGQYTHATGFGSIFARFDGTYRLSTQDAFKTGAPYAPDSADLSPRLRTTATLGTTIGNLTAQTTYRYLDGYDVTPSVANNFQTSVDSFETLDLFFRYDFEAGGLFKGISLTANVNNVFDEDPSTYQGIFQTVFDGWANGGTIGRLYQVGLKVNF